MLGTDARLKEVDIRHIVFGLAKFTRERNPRIEHDEVLSMAGLAVTMGIKAIDPERVKVKNWGAVVTYFAKLNMSTLLRQWYGQFKARLDRPRCASLDKPNRVGNPTGEGLASKIHTTAIVDARDLLRAVTVAGRQRNMVKLRSEGWHLKDIGAKYGVSVQRVQQVIGEVKARAIKQGTFAN